MAVACTLHRCKLRLIKAVESRKFFFFFFFLLHETNYMLGGARTHTWVWVLKDISLQKQESSVSAGGSGSKALLFIVISLAMGISSLTHHHALNFTACKICPWILVSVVTMKKVSFLTLYLAWEGFSHVNHPNTTFCMSIYHVEDLRGFKKIMQTPAWWVSYR